MRGSASAYTFIDSRSTPHAVWRGLSGARTTGGVVEETDDGAIWEGCGEERGESGAAREGWKVEVGQRRQGREGEEPEAGDCDWVVGGAEEGGEGAEEESVVGAFERWKV